METKIAIISDVHGNLEALESVLNDIKNHGIEEIISLGDNVGYGPNPIEVIKLLHEKDVFTIEGNHDFAVLNPNEFREASNIANEAIEWTRFQLLNEVEKHPEFEEILAKYFDTSPYYILEEDRRVICVHGSPGNKDKRFDYIIKPQDLLAPSRYMRKKRLKICFFGHTHYPAFWEIDKEGVSVIKFIPDEEIIYTEDELRNLQIFINPGSVGQPRDKNPKASYLIYEKKDDQHIFLLRRVEYDIDKTVDKIYAIPEIDNILGDRLSIGA